MITLLSFCFMGCKSLQYEICTLKEGYEAGYITYEDLLNIAYQHGDSSYNQTLFENFMPQQERELSKGEEKRIKKAIVKEYNKETRKEYWVRAKDIEVFSYGYYNGYYALIYNNKNELSSLVTEIWETIDGVQFKYRDGDRVLLLKV